MLFYLKKFSFVYLTHSFFIAKLFFPFLLGKNLAALPKATLYVLLAKWLVLWTSRSRPWFDSWSEDMTGSDSSIIGGPNRVGN